MRILPVVIVSAAACGACGDDGGGAVDATPVVDIDNGSCGDQLRFTGELLDWDSSDTNFCGIAFATFTGGGGTDDTSPNGRFDMCIARDAQLTNVVVTPPPSSASQCATATPPFTIEGIAVANKATIQAGGFWSGRIFSAARMQTFFQAAGLTVDAQKAHVVVHVEGAQRGVAITATHDAAQAWSGTAWAAGEVGHDVFFPNVDVAGGSTMLSVVGGAVGTGTIPLAAGKLTYVSVLAL